ncbi:MAG: aspartate-semialdehyde dehydrogenase [Elusimicrobiales bacterium]|nr:aspartate-semialdehyde dehydrogenase [Elusimicrobiales bacterium]
MPALSIGVVGASGMVGGELLELLEKRRFPVGKIVPFNSGRREAFVTFRGKKYRCEAPTLAALKECGLVFFVSTDEVSARFAKKLAAAGTWCIDDSSYFRLDPSVPLVIPEVNAAELDGRSRLIAGPNCTITGAAVSLARVHRKFRIKELRLSTYQAVSGAGKSAMEQLKIELAHWLKKGRVPDLPGRKFPHPIAFNVFPQVGGFDAEGNSSEENKVSAELKKIWSSPDLRVSCTAARVPVLRGHSLAIWARTEKPWTLKALGREIAAAEGVEFRAVQAGYPTPLGEGDRTLKVYAGRLRRSETHPREFQLWAVSDNLYKGAAWNSVQIAEKLLAAGKLGGLK